jgi:xylose dehydrogenase (NAD/NADP)
MEPVRWGVLGAARIARRRVLPVLSQAPMAQLAAVASRDLAQAQSVAAQFGAGRAYGSYEALLADPDIEAVYVPLPNHLHREWAIAALRAGKHVLCEKPLALNAAQAREMADVARDANRLLLEAFMYRLGPTVLELVSIVRSGAIGELRALHASFNYPMEPDPANVRLRPEMGGGALYDIGSYCINIIRTVVGREPHTAQAMLRMWEQYGIDGNVTALLDFGDSLSATFDAGFEACFNTYFRAVGSRGILEAPQGFLGRATSADLVLTIDDQPRVIHLGLQDAYALEFEDMSQAIRGLRPARYGHEPLDANMRVIDACFASARTGRAAMI